MGRQTFDPRKLLPEFDNFLHQKGVKFKAVVIGSGALLLWVLYKDTLLI